jgi:hypothetical protein
VIFEQSPFLAVSFLEDVILGAEVLHHGLLLTIQPTGEAGEQELSGLQGDIHRSPNAAEEQERAASGMRFGVSIDRNSSLLGVQKMKNYKLVLNMP